MQRSSQAIELLKVLSLSFGLRVVQLYLLAQLLEGFFFLLKVSHYFLDLVICASYSTSSLGLKILQVVFVFDSLVLLLFD